MALTDKDILITPNDGSSTADPKTEFTGANSTASDTITLETQFDGSITTLSYEGSAGQLFSISNDLSGTIFAVNDSSGIPSLEINNNGEIRLSEFDGNVIVGNTNSTPLSSLFEGRLIVKGSGDQDPIMSVTDSTSTGSAAGVFHQSSTSPSFPAFVVNSAANSSSTSLISAYTNVNNTTGVSGTEVFKVTGQGHLTVTGTLNSNTVNTGQGSTEVHLMNQNIRTTDTVTFDELTVTDFVKASGNNIKFSAGGTHVLNIDLNRKVYPQTDNSTDVGFSSSASRFRDAYFAGTGNFGNINTGQGATEVHLMNQNLRTTDSPTFATLNVTGDLNITGDINTVSTTDLDILDKTITLGKGGSASTNDGAGIIVEAAGASLKWDNPDNYWKFNRKLAFDDTPTTTNQGLGIIWSGFDKEGTSDSTDNASIVHTTNTGGIAGSVLLLTSQNDSNDGIAFVTNGSSNLMHNSNKIWTAGNDGSGSGLDADTLDGKPGSDLFNFGYAYSSNNISRAVGSGAQWYKVASFSGGVKHITMKVHSSGDNTIGADSFFIAAGSYGMKANIVRMPSSKYNGTKLEEVRTKYVSGATYEIWVKVASITTSVGYLQVFMNDSGVTSSLSAGTEPTVGTADATLPVSASDRINYSLQATSKIEAMDGFVVNGNTVFHTGNDGSGSGLDADTVDGINSGSFMRSDTADSFTALPTFANGATGTLAARTGFSDFLGYNASYGSYIGGGVSNAGSKYLYAGGFMNDGGTVGTLWRSTNDGSGSGLDADTLDGNHASAFLTSSYTGFDSRYITKGGSWYGSNFPGSRWNGFSVNGGEIVFARDNPNSGQMSILVDGAYYAGENNGFYSIYSGNNYNNKVGFYGDSSGNAQFSSAGPYFQNNTAHGYIQLGPMNTSYAHIYTNISGGFYFNKTGLYANGNTIWHAGNDGSGSGLDADTLDGLQPNSGNVASTIVSRNSSGDFTARYIFATHFNQSSSNSENPTIGAFWTNSTADTYNRKSTPAHVISQLGLFTSSNDGSGSGLDADLLDGQQGSYYNQSAYTSTGNAAGSYLGGHYSSGGNEKPNSNTFNSGKFKIAMLSSSNLGFGGSWNDVFWNSSYNGGDVKRSTALVSSKYDNTSLWIVKQNYDSSSWGTGYLFWNAGNDGSGSGLDADTLDGVNSASFARSDAGTTYSNYGNLQRFYSNTNMATASGSQASLECFSNGSGNDAFMTFHVGGDYAIYLGLDGGTNKLSVGGWSMGANSYEIYHSGNKPTLAALGYTGATNANYITNNNQLTNGAGYITGVTDISGYSGQLLREDNRTISPSELTAGRLKFGFTSWGNNNTSPYADFLHLRSYTDASGGNDNLLMFNKSSKNMRLYQQSYGSSTAYSSYVDFWHTGNDGSGSGLDADTVDGIQGASFLRSDAADTATQPITLSGGSGTSAGLVINRNIATPSNYYNGLQMEVRATSGTAGIGLHRNGYSHVGIYTNAINRLDFDFNSGDVIMNYNAGTLWGSGNDGSGSGLDADTLDGTQLSAIYTNSSVANTSVTKLYENTTITYGGSYLQWTDLSGTGGAGTNGNAPGNPFSDWHHHLIMNHGNSGGYYVDQAFSFHSNRVHFRRNQNGSLSSWYEFWHTGNDGSGSGLDADTLDGVQLDKFLQDNGSQGDFRNQTDGSVGNLYLGHTPTSGTGSAYIITQKQTNVGQPGAIIFYISPASTTNTTTSTHLMHKFEADGDAHHDGDVIAYSTTTGSDRKLKENIRDLEGSLDKTLKLRGVKFDWKDENKANDQLGFIAQEVEEILPEVVKEVETLTKEDETHLTVNYPAVVPLLVEAIKEQQSIINRLEERLSDLENKLK